MNFRRAWHVCGWCALQGGRLCLWTAWLLLIAALAAQGYLLSLRSLPISGPLQRFVERRLAEEGLRLDYSQGSINFEGHLLLENVRLSASGSPADPLATARFIYVHIDPWDLLAGRIDVKELRVEGLDLHLPAALSGKGIDETPASDINFALRTSGRQLELSYLSGYIGRLSVQAAGQLKLPAKHPDRPAPGALMDRAVDTWTKIARQASQANVWLAAAENPELHILLTPADVSLAFDAASIDLGAFRPLSGGKVGSVRAFTRLPLAATLKTPLHITGSIDGAELPQGLSARDLAFDLRTAGGLKDVKIEARLGSARWREIESGPVILAANQTSRETVTADVSLGLAGGFWRVQVEANPGNQTAGIQLDGFVDDETLAFAGARIKRDLSALLDPVQAAPLHATALLSSGWKLKEAHGRLHSGSVRVGTVQLDETGTEFSYDGARVLCDSLVLRQGESLAHGSYEMDTKTMDFRFLLTGGLRPMGISGWFHDWWTNFWNTFDFDRGLPVADVDVQGRWGDRYGTHVFVQADAAGSGIKGVAFDRVSTRLFLRPQWFDIRHFEVAQGNRTAQGWFARSMDLSHEKDAWLSMEFSVGSTLPLETISQLFKAESAELLAPYFFTVSPQMHLSGRVDSAGSPQGKHEQIDIDLVSSGPMTYHDFPLSDLKFKASVRDDRIQLPVIDVGFAGGQAGGNARLWGPATERHLAFDITLKQANLGAVTQAVSKLQPPVTAPADKDKSSEAARVRMERLERGRLDFTLAAEGMLADFHSFKGSGRGAVTGAELAQLNLFGPLSEALSGSFINFGSFSLNTVEAPFVLDGERVHFEDLRVTGPSALLQAKGNYHLKGGRLDFTTKIHPFEESPSVVGSAVGFVLTPFTKVFEVKLQGTLSNPSWIFAYGPSRLLNTIAGENPPESAPPASPVNKQ